MRLRASQSGPSLHIPLRYISPVETDPAAAAVHQSVHMPGQEGLDEAGNAGQTDLQGKWDPAFGQSPGWAAMKGEDQAAMSYKKAGSDSSSERSVLDTNGLRILYGKERWGLTNSPFTEQEAFDEGRPRSARTPYLEGLRGILALQTLLWLFFRVFAPAIVADTDLDGTRPAYFVTHSPDWMSTIRKLLKPILFDGSTQMAMYIILIGRTNLQTFVERRNAVSLAGACFRRPIRILVPIALTMALISVLTATNGFKYASLMATDLHNQAVQPPEVWGSPLQYSNSLLSLLYEPYADRDTRAVNFIPAGRIAWFVDIAFQQTYVLTVFAFTLPYTVLKYKIIGLGTMVVLSAWVARWSWYTVTGLVLAEFAVVYRSMLPDRASSAMAQRGQRRVSLTPPKVNRLRDTLTWTVPLAMVVLGVLFKYVWAAAAPENRNQELLAHANLNTAKLSTNFDPLDRAYPRYDDWCLCTGLLVLIELSDTMQNLLSASALVYLGRLGFSVALLSGTILISLGGLLHTHLVQSLHWTNPSQILFVEFLAMVPCCLLCADWWSRLVDDSALRLSHWFFHFARN